MSNPTSGLSAFANATNEIFAGTTTDIWIYEGGILPSTPGYFPRHGLELQGVPSTSKAISRKFTGGTDATPAVTRRMRVTVTTYTNLVDGVSTLTVAGNVYTFVSGTPSGSQIQIGASNNATATNIRNKVNTDLTPDDLSAVTVNNTVVTFLGLTDGTTFDISTNQGTALTIATPVAGSAEVTATASTLTIRCRGRFHVAGTINQVTIPMLIGDSIDASEIYFQFDTPSDDSTNLEIINGIKDVVVTAMDEELIQPSGSRVFSSNPNDSPAAIADAIVNLFGSESNFVIDDALAKLTITAANTGASGNNIALGTEILPSLPSPLISIDSKGRPQVDGFCRHLGTQQGFQITVTPQVLTVNASNFKQDYTHIVTSLSLEIGFKLFQDKSVQKQKYGLSGAAIASNDSNDVLLFGGLAVPAQFALILTSQSAYGGYDALVIYNCEAQALTINRDKNTLNGLDVKLTPNAFNRQADSVGYVLQARSTAE